MIVEPVSADEVHVTHDLIVLEVAQEPRVIATGRYDKSVVVRTDAGWRFKSRTLAVDPASSCWPSSGSRVPRRGSRPSRAGWTAASVRLARPPGTRHRFPAPRACSAPERPAASCS